MGGTSVKESQEGHVTGSEFDDFEEGLGKRWPLPDWMLSKAGAVQQLRVSVMFFEKVGEIKLDWDAIAQSSSHAGEAGNASQSVSFGIAEGICWPVQTVFVFTQKRCPLLVCINIKCDSSRGSPCGRHYLKWWRSPMCL